MSPQMKLSIPAYLKNKNRVGEEQAYGGEEPTRVADTPGSVDPAVDAGFSHLTSAGSALLLM